MAKDIGLDSILEEIGPFGRYNIINYAFLLFPIYLAGMYGSVYVFEASDIGYRCNIPQCEALNESSWLEFAIPREKKQLSRCKRFGIIDNMTDVCSKDSFNTSDIWECDKLVYNDEDSAVRDISTNEHMVHLMVDDSSATEHQSMMRCRPNFYFEHSEIHRLKPNRVICTSRQNPQDTWNNTRLLLDTLGPQDSLFTLEFNLGCQDWKRTLIGTIHNAGLFVSLPMTGIISDKYGRKLALSVASLMNGIFGCLRSFSSSYTMLVIFEFLEAALGAGAYSTAFVLAMELVGPKGRVFGNTLINAVYVLGLMTLASLSWYLQNWRNLLRIIYIPATFVLSYIWILNESVRWLISKGKHHEAATILKKAAKMNKVGLSDQVLSSLYEMDNFSADQEKCKEDNVVKNKKDSIFTTVIKSSIIRKRIAVCSFLWITCTFVYYGLSINSVSLAGNKYVNFMLVGFVEIPANFVCLLVLDRFGRKRVLIITYVLSACLCIGLSFVPKGQKWWSLVLYLSGKFSITVAYSSVYIYVSEVFPTSVRQSLLAVCSSLGRVGSTLAPLTPLLALYYDNLPAIFFGSLALIASVLVFSLPETINQPLPDTIEEAERLSHRNGRKEYT